MAKAVKKKAKASISESELRKLADKAMVDFNAEATERFVRAKQLYDRQSGDAQDAITRMTNLLCRIAKRQMWVGIGKGDRVVMDIPEQTIYHNMFYLACEILKDLAQMDVMVSGFKIPADLCAECYIELKPAKKKVKS
jgi:hypothetical protein